MTARNCSRVGTLILGLGTRSPYDRPQRITPPPAPVRVELLNVELTTEPLSDLDQVVNNEPRRSDPTATPLAPATVVQPQLSQPTAVAEYSPAIAFALPVEGPVRVVATQNAAAARPGSTNVTATAFQGPVQSLTFGLGEGRQPAPEYPARALHEGQQGRVTVRFSVDATGHVVAAEAATPSQWALLNESAVRVVRERWRFPSGMWRIYEVAIKFELTN